MSIFKKIKTYQSEAKNHRYTSCNRLNSISMWQTCTGRRANKCSFNACENDADVGGHLELKGRNNRDYHYVAPICYYCKYTDFVNYRTMKRNVAYMRIPINCCLTIV